MREWWDEQPKNVLAGLIAVDLALIVLHVATGGGRDPITSLDNDLGLAGFWNFSKAVVAGLVTYSVFRRLSMAVYLAWAVTFVTVGLDDLLEIHERAGDWLARSADLPEVMGLRGADLGELLAWAALGVPLLIAIGLTVRNADARARTDSVRLFVLMVLLVVAAAGLDAAHMALSDDTVGVWDVTPIGVLEDGGEIMFVSLLLTTALAAQRWRAAE